MISDEMFAAIRDACTPASWTKGVEWARGKRVGVESEGPEGELHLRVSQPDKPVSAKVVMILSESDWTCDCKGEDPCAHVAASAIAIRRAKDGKRELPKYVADIWIVVYRFTGKGGKLTLERVLKNVRSGAKQPVNFSLVALAAGRIQGPAISPTSEDLAIELILDHTPQANFTLKHWAMLFQQMRNVQGIVLDGAPVKVSPEPRGLELMVDNDGVGVRIKGRQDPCIKKTFSNGVVLDDERVLHPIPDLRLPDADMKILRDGLFFGPRQYTELVSEVIPRFRNANLLILIKTNRLPDASAEEVRLAVEVEKTGDGRYEARPRIAYGNPIVAWVEHDRLEREDEDVWVPLRDPVGERQVKEECSRKLGYDLDETIYLGQESAVAFRAKLARHNVPTFGDSLEVYRTWGDLVPQVDLSPANFSAGFILRTTDAKGQERERFASWDSVWRAWRDGNSMVPLLDGGFAKIPEGFMREHGHQIQDLLVAKADDEKLPDVVWGDAARLAKDMGVPVPRPFAAMRDQIENFSEVAAGKLGNGFEEILRPYQKEGVRWLNFIRSMSWGGLLADDMGLGKTVQTIACIEPRTLIAAPASVIWNWKREIERFAPKLKVNLYHGPGRKISPKDDVIVTSHGTLRQDVEQLAKEEWEFFVIDEAQSIKNPESLLLRAVCEINAKSRMALTGTPVENSLTDLWSIFRFLDPGLLGTLKDFRDRYANPVGRGDEVAMARLRERIRPFMLRRRKGEVLKDLPMRTEVVLRCSLSEEEQGLYNALLAGVRGELNIKAQMVEILEAILRLRQAACHPKLLPGDNDLDSSKVGLLADKLEEAVSEGHKALVFSQWTSLLDLVEPVLESRNIEYLRLDGSTTDRQGVVDSFQAEKGPPVLIMSLKAGGVGLNLTAADHVFIMDPWWNPAAEDQAADRAHRIGQTNPVTIYKLVAAGTIEERILLLQEEKRKLANAAVEGTGGGIQLTKEDLLTLLEH